MTCRISTVDHNLYSLLIYIFTMASLLSNAQLLWAHGGTPRILSIHYEDQRLSILDTLGFFETTLPPLSAPDAVIEGLNWQWLCDDAVDPMAGIDAAVRLNENILLAVSRSGVYRSEDQGCSFQALGEPLSLHSIPHLIAHPTDPLKVAVATYTLGKENDVFTSDDGGRTWQAAGLNIEGGIYALWRNPHAPNELWVSHAQGLSWSEDGGRSFSQDPLDTEAGLSLSLEETRALVSRPQALKLMGGGLITEGTLSGQQVTWMSVNLYPNSTLLQRINRGPWIPIHQVADSYESLAFTGKTLVVSTTFQGLFRRSFADDSWTQQADLALSCLSASENKIWACGRGDAREWLVGVSLDEGAQWLEVWKQYRDASGATWNCSDQASSINACLGRCLDEGCDPSGQMMGGTPVPVAGESIVEGGMNDSASEQSTPIQSQGCQQSLSSDPFWLTLLLLCLSYTLRSYTLSDRS